MEHSFRGGGRGWSTASGEEDGGNLSRAPGDRVGGAEASQRSPFSLWTPSVWTRGVEEEGRLAAACVSLACVCVSACVCRVSVSLCVCLCVSLCIVRDCVCLLCVSVCVLVCCLCVPCVCT